VAIINDITMAEETPLSIQDKSSRAEQDGDNAGLEFVSESAGKIEFVGDSFLVDWDGPEDAGNPLNWSPGKRWAHIVIIAILGLITYVLS